MEELYINPFYVFNGTVLPDKYIEMQVELLDEMGPEEYFRTQLNVLYSAVSNLIVSIKDEDNKVKVNTNLIGHA